MAYGRILLTENDRNMRTLLYDMLAEAGFFVSCTTETGVSGSMINRRTADIALLGVSPQSEYCRKLLEKAGRAPEIPVVVMLAGECRAQKLSYLDMGADEVLIKPVDVAELTTKLRAIMRRDRSASIRATPGQLVAPLCGISVDMYSYTASAGGNVLNMPPKDIEILHLLLCNPERVFRRGEIAAHVWGENLASERTIDTHICRIKQTLGKPYSDCIVTVRGVGYKITSG